MKHQKGKRVFLICTAVAAILACGIGFAVMAREQKNAEMPNLKEREYMATMGDITVGIEAGGKIFFQNIPHDLPKDIQIDEVFVKPGSYVQKGTPLWSLTTDQAEKNEQIWQEKYNRLNEKQEELEEEKREYLLHLSWSLENEKEMHEEKYNDAYWKIENAISDLEEELSNAQWKRDFWEDEPLIRASIAELEKNLRAKQAEQNSVKQAREKEIEQENDPEFQKKKQEKEMEKFEQKSTALQNERTVVAEEIKAAKESVFYARADGVVLKVNFAGGQSTDGEKPVVELGNSKQITLKLVIEPENIVDIQEGQNVDFFVDAYPDQILTGVVQERVLTPDTEGKFGVLVKVNPNDLELLDGMSASGTVVLKKKSNILTLSNKAIVTENGKQYVKLKNAEGALQKAEITTGFSDGRTTEILNGLQNGDRVYVDGR